MFATTIDPGVEMTPTVAGTLLYIGEEGGYRDELSFARREGAAKLPRAKRSRTLDWAARLVFHVVYPGCDAYVTDPVDVHKLTREHDDAQVEILPVRAA
ncbi:MAG: hypothetical protein RIB45_03155 [Marivibrio sp.]|uniref:hypothetical protein n=1 Tax=Marivibrio sp. TaxID=2039719 RepID=UPI0032EBAC8F